MDVPARRLVPLGLVALLLLVLAACTSSGNTGTSGGVLRVGTEGTYAPFTYHDGTGALVGYDVDVARAVGDQLGMTVEFTETPFDSIFAGLGADRYDVVANQVTITPKRQQLYDLTEPYTVGTGVIVTRADDTSVTSVADLAGKTAAESSTSNWSQVARDAGAKVEAVEGFTQAITLLQQGRVDVVVNDSVAVAAYLATTGDTSVKVAAPAQGEPARQAFALRKGSPLTPEINGALATLRADGTLTRLSQQYLGTDATGDGSVTGTAATPTPGTVATSTATSTAQVLRDNALPMLKALVSVMLPLTAISFVLGLVLALGVALARMSASRALSAPARVYISLIRGTPLLVQLVLIFYALPSLGVTISPFPAAVIAFSLNVGGYAAEIIRAAVLSVPRGQWEAATTVGMGRALTLRRIVLPQALRTAVPPLSNTLLSLVKDTSLASTILVTELFRQAQIAAAPTFQFLPLYGLAAAYYWVVCLGLSFGQDRLETRLERFVAS